MSEFDDELANVGSIPVMQRKAIDDNPCHCWEQVKLVVLSRPPIDVKSIEALLIT